MIASASPAPVANESRSRDTPLAEALKRRIRVGGPIGVADYMQACLLDPEHGYYRRSTAIGREGDFVTAPEISQVFGEILGLWAAAVWRLMGAPKPVHLVELGPGRGTMMRDVLRAARIVPGFTEALRVALVEPGERMRDLQHATLASVDLPMTWMADLRDVPPGPAVVLANEVLDALPVHQAEWSGGGWRRRMVALDTDRLAFSRDGATIEPPADLGPAAGAAARDGDVLEWRVLDDLMGALAARSTHDAVAGLFLDYGHTRSEVGDTLQAVRGQAAEHPLASPGEADLSAAVDFEQVARAARSQGLVVGGPVTQAEFLGALGIVERASRLMATNPGQALAIETAVARLIAPGAMGQRFKAIALYSSGLPALPALPGIGAASEPH